jgi:glutathione reductase (NADPH)
VLFVGLTPLLSALFTAQTDRVVGVHMFGSGAGEHVQCLAVALTGGLRKRDFDRTVALHPTSAEEWMLMFDPVPQPQALPAK